MIGSRAGQSIGVRMPVKTSQFCQRSRDRPNNIQLVGKQVMRFNQQHNYSKSTPLPTKLSKVGQSPLPDAERPSRRRQVSNIDNAVPPRGLVKNRDLKSSPLLFREHLLGWAP